MCSNKFTSVQVYAQQKIFLLDTSKQKHIRHDSGNYCSCDINAISHDISASNCNIAHDNKMHKPTNAHDRQWVTALLNNNNNHRFTTIIHVNMR